MFVTQNSHIVDFCLAQAAPATLNLTDPTSGAFGGSATADDDWVHVSQATGSSQSSGFAGRGLLAALSNSFGFGGTNASLLFTRPDF